MYDLHNHLLPGIDDGAPDIDTTIAMAKMAVADGITHMVCTPHIHYGRFDNDISSIANALSIFKQALNVQKIKLQVTAAAEVRIAPEIMDSVMQNKLPFLGLWQGKRVLLIEFPRNSIPIGSEKLIRWLMNINIVPMIAHPERNLVFQQHPNRLDSFIKQGCLLQVTAGALLNGFGETAKMFAEQLIVAQKVTLVASDAHNLKYRPPRLKEAFNRVSNLKNPQYAQQLFIENPQTIAQQWFEMDTESA